MRAYAAGDRVRIDVEDSCGGPPRDAETMFLPFTQCGTDRSGIGLGLAICRRSVEANHGVVSVRDRPGSGCVFTIDLPRHSLTQLAAPVLCGPDLSSANDMGERAIRKPAF